MSCSRASTSVQRTISVRWNSLLIAGKAPDLFASRKKGYKPCDLHPFRLRIHSLSLTLMNRFASLVIENKLVVVRAVAAKHVVQRAS